MSAMNVVVEIDGFSSTAEDLDLDAMAAAGALGVLVKLSQGTRWVNPYGAEICENAHEVGLLVGVLHVLETDRNEPEVEASYVLGVLPKVPLQLGVVLEIDPHNGADMYGLSVSLEQAHKIIAGRDYAPGLRCSAEVLTTLTGAPGPARWWAGSVSDMVQAHPFALWGDSLALSQFNSGGGAYSVVSTRGLNPAPPVPSTLDVQPHGAVGHGDVPVETTVQAAGPSDQDEIDPVVESVEPLHGDEDTPDDDEVDPESEDTDKAGWREAARAHLATA